MTHHPTTPELVIDGLISDPSIRDDILGDLAEEWAERRERDGIHSANWWYCMQGFRAVPHLVLAWWIRTPWYVLVSAIVAGIVIRTVIGLVGVVVLMLVAIALRFVGMEGWPVTALASLGTASCAFAGGALIARLFRRSPMPAVFWLTLVVFLSAVTVTDPIDGGLVAYWYPLSDKLFSIPATMAGGILFVYLSRRRMRAPHETPA
jgi:hypothetical protein